MADTDDENYVSNLQLNALLMLSFYGQGSDISPAEKASYHALLSREEASEASVFLLHLLMSVYSAETGKSREELVEHLRTLLLELSSSEE